MAAARAFGREPDPAFLPHLSLVYGTLGADEKNLLTAELRSEVGLVFAASSLHVWRTEGEAADWREIASFAFASR